MGPWFRSRVSASKQTPASASDTSSTVNGSTVSVAKPGTLKSSALNRPTRRWSTPLESAKQQLASHLKLAQARLQEPALSRQTPSHLADELAAIALATGELRTRLESALEESQPAAGEVAQEAMQLGHRALRVFAHFKSWNLGQRKKLRQPQALETLRLSVSDLLEAALEYLQRLTQAIDYHKNIDTLGNGDVYLLELGEHRSLGALEVTRRSDGLYLLKVDGAHILRPFFSQPESPLRGDVVCAEFLLKTAVEARKATGVFLRHAVSALEDASAPSPNSVSDADVFGSKWCALELRGPLAEALHGVSFGEAPALPASPDGELGIRLEMFSEGAPSLLLFRRHLTDSVSNEGDFPSSEGMTQTHGALTLRAQRALPRGIGASLKAQPLPVLASLASQSSEVTQAEIVLSTAHSAGTPSLQLKTRLTVSGNPRDIFQSGATTELANGQLRQALIRAGTHAQVRASVEPHAYQSVTLSASLGEQALGLALPIEASRSEPQLKTSKTFAGSALSAARELANVFLTVGREFLKSQTGELRKLAAG